MHRRGGNCPNTLEVLRQLLESSQDSTLHLTLCAVLPAHESLSTRQIKSSLGKGIDLTHCIHREGYREAASSYVIRSQSTGTRTLINYNNLPEMTYDEFVAVADRLADVIEWCHFEAGLT